MLLAYIQSFIVEFSHVAIGLQDEPAHVLFDPIFSQHLARLLRWSFDPPYLLAQWRNYQDSNSWSTPITSAFFSSKVTPL